MLNLTASQATTGRDNRHELVSGRYLYITDLRFRMTLFTTDRTQEICLSLLHCKFIKGSPNLFDKVVEVSCPIKFVNQDGESW